VRSLLIALTEPFEVSRRASGPFWDGSRSPEVAKPTLQGEELNVL
jgi:hypothetical protein